MSNTPDELVEVNWKFDHKTYESITAAAAIVAARELKTIRIMLESLGRYGIHQVIREYKQQVPIMRAKRIKAQKASKGKTK